MEAEPDIAELLAARPWLRMDAMDGLMMDGVALNAIADELGTPAWVYSAPVLRARIGALRAALEDAGVAADLHYAVKACDHLAVLRVMAREGAGADVVSGGELRRALAAGIAAERIVFSGVGKTAAELRLAIGEGIGQVMEIRQIQPKPFAVGKLRVVLPCAGEVGIEIEAEADVADNQERG